MRDLAVALRVLSGGAVSNPVAIRSLIESARTAFATRGIEAPDLLRSIESLFQDLESAGDEPSEAWMPGLEEVLTAMVHDLSG